MTPNPSTQILWTDKLDIFQQHGQQRALIPGHIKQLQDSIVSFGFLTSKPIQCFRDGKHLRVIDGHHRMQAAKNVKVGVYYVIVPKTESAIIGTINSAVRRWDTVSFINYYATAGNAHYVKLRQYIESGLTPMVAVNALGGHCGPGGNQSNKIATGEWEVRSIQHADKLIEIMEQLDGMAVVKSTPFLMAVLVLLHLPQFDIEWFIQRLQKNPGLIERRSNRDQMLELIEEAYNLHRREKTNLAFLAKEFLRGRKAAHFGKKD